MNTATHETQRREKIVREAIQRSFGTEAGEFGATLFATHHLEELEPAYWLKHLGTETPDPEKVLGILQLKKTWGEDEGSLDFFDFTLPDQVTHHVVCVKFDGSEAVEEISMES